MSLGDRLAGAAMQLAQAQRQQEAVGKRRRQVSAAALLTLLAVFAVSAAQGASASTWPASAFPYGDAAGDSNGRADDAGWEVSL